MFCFKCGTKLQDGALFCHSCGSKTIDINSLESSNVNPNTNTPYTSYSNTASELASASRTTGTAAANIVTTAVSTGAKTAKIALKAKILFSTIVLAMITAGVILYNMFFATSPMKTVDKFIGAINDKDMNTAIECMDPKYEKMYKAGTSLLGGVLGFDIKDVLDLSPAIFDIAKANGMKADLKIEKSKVIKEEKNGDKATVVIEIKAESVDDNGKKDTETGQATFMLEKFDEGWRIIEFK